MIFQTFRKSGNNPLLKDILVISLNSSGFSFEFLIWYAIAASSFILFKDVLGAFDNFKNKQTFKLMFFTCKFI